MVRVGLGVAAGRLRLRVGRGRRASGVAEAGAGVGARRRRGGRRAPGERELAVDLIEVGLPLDVGQELPLVGGLALHQGGEVRQAPEEALMIIGAEVVAGLVEPLETPAVELPGE